MPEKLIKIGKRRAILVAPSSPNPVPLLLAVHGSFQNVEKQPGTYFGIDLDFRRMSGLDLEAERRGFAVCYPIGIQRGLQAWKGKEDLNFLTELLIHFVANEYETIDDREIVISGFSDGGEIIDRVAGEVPGIVSGLIRHSGNYGSGPGEVTNKFPVLIVIGTRDQFAPRWLPFKRVNLRKAAHKMKNKYERLGHPVSLLEPDCKHEWWKEGNGKLLGWAFPKL